MKIYSEWERVYDQLGMLKQPLAVSFAMQLDMNKHMTWQAYVTLSDAVGNQYHIASRYCHSIDSALLNLGVEIDKLVASNKTLVPTE